jgi:predicted DNA-binding transcriptional regulator AlpA
MRDRNGNGSGSGNDRLPFKVLRCREVVALTGLSRATIYRLMEDEEFPHSHGSGGVKRRSRPGSGHG